VAAPAAGVRRLSVLEHISSFHTLAQIGVALAGFAGLAAAMGVSSEKSVAVFARLRGVVLNGLLLAVGAMVPILIDGFDLPYDLIWRIAAGVLLVLNWLGLLIGMRMYGAETTLSLVDKAFVIPLEVSVQLLLLTVILGIFSSHGEILIVTFLVLVLLQGIAMFLSFFDQVFYPSE